MHYVIVGESRSGKSMLANLICTNLSGYCKISVDALVMAFKKAFPNLKINYYSNKKNEFHVFLEEFLLNCIHMSAKGTNYILEGADLPYETILKLNSFNFIKVLFLGKTQLTPKEFFNEIRNHEATLETGGWTKRLDNKTLLSWSKGWIEKSKKNQEFCIQNNILYIDTSINQLDVLNNIVNQIKQKESKN